MDFTTILYEKTDGVAVITLNRPEKKNAINLKLSRELMQALTDADTDNAISAVIITGGPDCFCAGADLGDVQASATGEPPVDPGMTAKIKDFPKPLIGAIGGVCVAGGLEIAMMCDIRLAADTARIGDGHIKMGLLGPGGAVVTLPQLVGVGMSKELIYTGDLINGTECCRIGLVNHVYPKDKLLFEAKELAKRIARNPTNALKISKRAINLCLQLNEYEALHYSEYCSNEVKESPEFKERIAKFLKKG
jgi:enoyl-CoA hydratase/carnithine racemase